MGELTIDKNALMTRWMKLYLNLMIIRSSLPKQQEAINEMRNRLAECNEHMMAFFDRIGAEPEAEA